MGLCLISVVNITNGLIQSKTSDDMRGRVMSIYSLIFIGSQTLGGLLIGLVADRVSEPVAVFISSGVLAILAVVVYFYNPSLRKIT